MVTINDKDQNDLIIETIEETSETPAPRRRGRPPGSKNGVRATVAALGNDDEVTEIPEPIEDDDDKEGVSSSRRTTKQGVTGIGAVSNDGESAIGRPFTVHLTIEGTADLLFHRYSADEVEAKSNAAKGSRAKKTDDIQSYLYRNADEQICMPGRYLQRALQEAGRFEQDPRSPRKSAFDLCKAGIVVTPMLSPMIPAGKDGPTTDWDYLDRQRVVVQRSAVTRVRPAFVTGWVVDMEITSLLPEYITPALLRKLADNAGRFIGLADFRPTYGRFSITSWEVRRD